MRTTIDIDEQLLETAMRVFDVSTKKEAIETSLREAVSARRRREGVSVLGTIDLDLTLEDLEKDRAGD